MILLELKGLEAQDDIEVGIDLGSGPLDVAEITGDALSGSLRDLLVVSPFADHVWSTVAANIE